MDEFGLRLAVNNPAGSLPGAHPLRQLPVSHPLVQPSAAGQSNVLHGNVDLMPPMAHVAYMLNHKFEVLWLTGAIREGLLGLSQPLPPAAEDRNIFKLLLSGAADPDGNQGAMLRMNLALAKATLSLENLLRPLRGMPSAQLRRLEALYGEVDPLPQGAPGVAQAVALRLGNAGGAQTTYSAFANHFREGIFVVISPPESDAAELQRALGRRDIVRHTLQSKRLPVLTDMVVMATHLQEAGTICAELPPEEYFELLRQIHAMGDEIFRAHHGVCVKNDSGVTGYFLPQADSSYVMNALNCAWVLKTVMAHVSKEWQLRKNWRNELYLNTGLNEGQEWLGAIPGAQGDEFVVLGDIVNHTTRLCGMAQFGQIWATKSFVGKLPAGERANVDFGIERVDVHGQHVLVPSSYARISDLLGDVPSRLKDFHEIAALAVTQIRSRRH
jgi:adenylate cyclase